MLLCENIFILCMSFTCHLLTSLDIFKINFDFSFVFLYKILLYFKYEMVIFLQNIDYFWFSKISLAATKPVAAAVTIFPALPAPSPIK